jgi:hypothetical protein
LDIEAMSVLLVVSREKDRGERTAGTESVDLAREEKQEKPQGEQGTQTQTQSGGHGGVSI